MGEPTLVVITEAAVRGASVTLERMTEVCRLAQPGTVAVQLRDRDWPVRARLELGAAIRRITAEWGQQLWVNDRLDLALLLSADALHLPTNGVAACSIRHHLTANGIRLAISEAVHDLNAPSVADIAMLSPIFESRKGRAALGADALTDYRRRHPTPAVYALGGVDATTAPLALRAGARGVAAIGAPHEAPRALLASLGLLR